MNSDKRYIVKILERVSFDSVFSRFSVTLRQFFIIALLL